MEQDKDAVQSQYTPLHVVAEEEYRNRTVNRGFCQNRYPGLSGEELAAAEKKDYIHWDLLGVLHSFFDLMSKQKLSSPKQLIVIPMRLAGHMVLGSDHAMKVITGLIELSVDLVTDYRLEIGKLMWSPSIREAAAKLLQDKYISNTTTYAEVVFLHLFCTWLGVGTNSLSLDVTSIVEKAKTDNDFTFQKSILEEAEFLPGLRYNVTQQYSFLEQLLQRL